MKLSALLAVGKDVKSTGNATITRLHHLLQKPSCVVGIRRNYAPKTEGGEQLPSEATNVQVRSAEALREATSAFAGIIDVILKTDLTNTKAHADIVVDGTVLATAIPATTLLSLEKQLVDLSTFVEKIPELDQAESWALDEGVGEYRSTPSSTLRTKKVQQPLVLYPATDKHPAQVQMITEDVAVGTWTITKFSGALPRSRREFIAERVRKLLAAVKIAREEANAINVVEREIGSTLMSWVLA